MADTQTLLSNIKAIVRDEGVELTAKQVRVQLEERLGLEEGSLKPRKKELSDLIDQVLEQLPTPAADGDGGGEDTGEQEEEEDEEEEAPPAKKPKKGGKAAVKAEEEEGGAAGKNHSCKTRSGTEAPKDLKKLQGKMKMTGDKFLQTGPTIAIDICGNKLTGAPRVFSSGARGWYLGGKIEIPIGGKSTVWAQAGLNITIPGSQEWP